MTDAALEALSHGEVARVLERAHLSYCVRLTIQGVRRLLITCERLTHLSLTGVPVFMRKEVQKFCREVPEEFSAGQRLMFCVFSGMGVKKLREYLEWWNGEEGEGEGAGGGERRERGDDGVVMVEEEMAEVEEDEGEGGFNEQ